MECLHLHPNTVLPVEAEELPGLAGGGAGGTMVVHRGLAPHVQLAVHLPHAAALDTHNQQGADTVVVNVKLIQNRYQIKEHVK